MKNRVKLSLLAASLAAGTAQAELIQADGYASGDQRAVYDTVTGLTWLDLTETSGQAYGAINARLGSDLSGWRLPTTSEIGALFAAAFAGVPSSSEFDAGGNAPWLAQIDAWNALFGTVNGKSSGWYQDAGTLKIIETYQNVIYGPDYQYNYEGYRHSGHHEVGIFLVKDVANVPIPLGLGALGLGLLGLAGRRRQR